MEAVACEGLEALASQISLHWRNQDHLNGQMTWHLFQKQKDVTRKVGDDLQWFSKAHLVLQSQHESVHMINSPSGFVFV